ncbi:expressed unknown protein [Seminavis robusta]|uniref:Uncharacterized protein n=1 Tax=Seminavis robusta TaxID=568900 RepID=A0A9N8D6Y3_9STRA|nr:expressed unknown protein [Seminavis robusta]|eukprot:Sro16_g011950.1 n/a (493) ;mRNA; f:171726-173302
MNHLTASFTSSAFLDETATTRGDTDTDDAFSEEKSWQRAHCEVDQFLRNGEWLDTIIIHSNNYDEARDYGYLLGFIRKHNDFSAQLFGGYRQDGPGSFLPFQFLEKEQQKKAYPIAYLIAARAPLEVIQEVYQMYPSARLQRQGEDQGTLLHVACRHGVSLDVLVFLLEKSRQEHALLEVDQKGNLPLHYAAKCRHWQQPLDVFQTLLNDHTTVIQHLVAHLLPETFGGAIQLSASVINESCARNLAHVLPKLLINHHCMEHTHSLVLKSCNVDQGALRIIFASAVTTPISVLLANCKVLDHRDDDDDNNNHDDTQMTHGSAIEELCIDDCSMKEDCFLWLLDCIQHTMPRLKHLTLTNPSRLLRQVDITNFVVSMLVRVPATTLSYLSIDGFAIDLNKALIDTLAHENTTTYVCYKNNVHDPRVRYYSTLNRYGRSIAQNPGTTRQTLVALLHAVLVQEDDSLDELLRAATVYGLLRECPIVWSSTEAEQE